MSLASFARHPHGSRRTAVRSLPLALAAAAFVCTTARAADHIVNPGGSIQAAIDAATPGDRILVQPGTYHESLDLRGKRLELIGTGGAGNTTIDATGFVMPVIRAKSGEPLGTRIYGFRMRGGDGEYYLAGSLGPFTYGGGIFVGNGSTLRVEACVISLNGYSGTINTDYGGGLYVGRQGSYLEMERCVFQDNFAWVSGGIGFVDSEGTLRLDHCTTVGNFAGPGPGALAIGPGAVVEVVDSILWDLADPEIVYLPSFPNGSIVGITTTDVRGGFAGTGNINLDPLFENTATGDLDLNAGSPCIDGGDPVGMHDPDGTIADMGAYPRVAGNPLEGSCFGDGSGAACPCGNEVPAGTRAGCLNSTGHGGQISATGLPRLSNDTLTLIANGVSNTSVGLFFQGTGTAGSGMGLAFGDGLRCVGGTVRRIGVRTAAAGTMSLGHANPHDAHIAFAGHVPLAGANLYYQVWYRDAATYCTAATFNLTNGLRVRWIP